MATVLFLQPPLISFKSDKNTGNFLVSSALKSDINQVLLNAHANDATPLLSTTMRAKSQNPSDRLTSLIAQHAPQQMLSIAEHALYAKRYTLVKQGGD